MPPESKGPRHRENAALLSKYSGASAADCVALAVDSSHRLPLHSGNGWISSRWPAAGIVEFRQTALCHPFRPAAAISGGSGCEPSGGDRAPAVDCAVQQRRPGGGCQPWKCLFAVGGYRTNSRGCCQRQFANMGGGQALAGARVGWITWKPFEFATGFQRKISCLGIGVFFRYCATDDSGLVRGSGRKSP